MMTPIGWQQYIITMFGGFLQWKIHTGTMANKMLEEKEQEILNYEYTKRNINGIQPMAYPDGEYRTLTVPVFQQENGYYCGPATVKQVTHFIKGSSNSQSYYAGKLGTSSKSGTDRTVISEYLKNNVRSGYVYVSIGFYDSWMSRVNFGMRNNMPAVLDINTNSIKFEIDNISNFIHKKHELKINTTQSNLQLIDIDEKNNRLYTSLDSNGKTIYKVSNPSNNNHETVLYESENVFAIALSGYQGNIDRVLEVTYKNDLSKLASIEGLEISYKTMNNESILKINFDEAPTEKTYVLSSKSSNYIYNRADIINVKIKTDGKVQTIKLNSIND